MDHSPTAALDRYNRLSTPERKLLELKEDRVLSALLHNMIAFMVQMKVTKNVIQSVAYQLLARCRLGSHFSAQITNLIDYLEILVRKQFFDAKLCSKSKPK